MKFDIKYAFKKSVEYSQKQYDSHYKLIHSVCAVPFLVLKKIEIYDFTINLILVLSIVYALAIIFKILYRADESIKSVIINCTVKSHPISTIFWMIIGGLVGMGINKFIEVREERIDIEEFQLAYAQYKNVVLHAYVAPREDCYDFAKGYEYYRNDDYVEAGPYLKKASEKCAVAAFLYGDILYRGLGVNCDKYEALKYYAQAAEKEVQEAKYSLMMHYFEENDYVSAEAYARDILNKLYFDHLDDLPIILTKESDDPSALSAILSPWLNRQKEMLDRCEMTYRLFYTSCMATEQYDNAAYFSDLINDTLFGGKSGTYAIDKAMCMLYDGDKFGAKRQLKKIMKGMGYNENEVILAEEAYVRHILLPEDKDITVKMAKEAEKLLIKNVKKGSRESLRMLRDLYRKGNYLQKLRE